MGKIKMINLGCGDIFHKDWINIDFESKSDEVIKHNLLEGIPFLDNEFDVVYHNNVLEHFSKSKGEFIISECYRVMKSGGILRVVVPDLEEPVKSYLRQLNAALKNDSIATENHEWLKIEIFDQFMRNYPGGMMGEYLTNKEIRNAEFIINRNGAVVEQLLNQESLNSENSSFKSLLKKHINIIRGRFCKKHIEFYRIGKFRMSGQIHYWFYDKFDLSKLLVNNGFVDVEVKAHGKSKISDWHHYELEPRSSRSTYPLNHLIIEARKQ